MLKIKYLGKREVLNFFELSDEHRKKVTDDHLVDDFEDQSYFINRYGDPELFEFMRMNNWPDLKSFHGYINYSFFHGALCILDDDCESFKLFDYCS
jgi:hypothetical protein